MKLDVVTLTQDLVRCPSITPEDAGAQEVLKKPLRDIGFEIFDLPFDGNGSYPVQNFFARLGSSSPHICYAGHTDVVPPGNEESWKHPPFDAVIEQGIMYGRGTSDMKGANAAFTVAVSEFLQSNPDFDGSISFLITGDEEAEAINGTVRALKWMKDNNHIPDMCLVGESASPTEIGQAIKIGRRGSLCGELTIYGTQGHTAYPDMADNPLPRLAKIADALSIYEFDQGTEHFPPTNLQITSIDVGNSARNVIPASGRSEFNIRFNTKWTMETLDQKLREIIEQITDDYTLTAGGNAHPFITQPGEWTNLVAANVKKHTNMAPTLSTSGGTSDARFVAPYCPVVEFGLTNESIHQVDEHLRIADLEKLVTIYRDILENTFKP
ncbi:MAG: succinyl-diaminopimelate desuccinylase [Alphaproteobacteria bacterium]|nr:succinyl-diaminopimelate desuccinylase [Alphaproteobacteria bacterium]